MKRLPQTLTAAALTGALAFGGAAVAQAQIPAPATIVVEGVTYEMQADGRYKAVAGFENSGTDEKGNPDAATPSLTKDQAQAIWERQQAENGENADPQTPGNETDSEGADDAEGTDSSNSDNEGIPAPATKEDSKGNTWYQSMKDPSIYVNDPALVNVEITNEMREAYAKAFPSDPQKPGFDAKKLAWLALPAALIIGGITWYLSQDGKTYVKDEARKNQQPTAEEKAASEQMLNANKNEVIAQGGKLADGAKTTGATRGMAAETGSNTVARGLAGLAVAAMVAAAAFAARRKFFA